ncbi:hypothetical protein HMPREF9333_01408 [Johnsonella ignava ATCC 51276]|jgi:Uncharacterized protein conserved in bacteria|uniref:DUF1307 domain-containing protein n=1 Tax=Johnsonella ignava ATCC 51276 TaxID=679200 RepID=G5GIL8_9FIRM|nr:DUF1307 domain-containing protein [Johnsonella ignava]EHI55272.1 hypothetical protein HMPREF9333_01408 [Johnsonella ignava ATCC 51276]
MKKLLSTLLVGAAVLSMAACSGGVKNTVSSTQADSKSESGKEASSKSESKSEAASSIAVGGSAKSESGSAGAVTSDDFKGEGKKVYTFTDGFNEVEATFTYKDNKVLSQTTHSKLMYSMFGLTNKEEAEKMFKPIVEKIQAVEGVKEELVFNDDHYVEDITVDFTKVDLAKLGEAQGTAVYKDESDLMMSTISQRLISSGYVEKK